MKNRGFLWLRVLEVEKPRATCSVVLLLLMEGSRRVGWGE
jgi:hypothetical protein